jgi:hypothetical protein
MRGPLLLVSAPAPAAAERTACSAVYLLGSRVEGGWTNIHTGRAGAAAQEWNEMHHLQIMESLGGDSLWLDRFMAQHGAIVYYWVLIGARLLTA